MMNCTFTVRIVRLCLFLALPMGLPGQIALAQEPLITEFLAQNDAALADEDGDYSDWIEIHNPGMEAARLEGWSLTDDDEEPAKWRFPQWTLEPGAYLLVFASGKDRATSSSQLHTNFSLSGNGEYLALMRPDGSVAHAYAPEFPSQSSDISYGLAQPAKESRAGYFDIPTPGTPNGPAMAARVKFSSKGGLFWKDFLLKLSTDSTGATIYYTLDGSEPTSGSILYGSPVLTTQTVRVRARACEPGLAPGPIASEGYIRIAEDARDFDSNLPLVVIDTFGYDLTGAQAAERPLVHRNVYSAFVEPDPESGRASLEQSATFVTFAGMHPRGRSSMQFPKKPYAFETWNAKFEDKSASILGLPPESDWIFQGPYSDKTLMRNYLTYKWFGDLGGRYSVRTRFVEVFINMDGDGTIDRRDYVGLYVFMEKVKRDENRVDVEKLLPIDNAPPEVTGGYVLLADNVIGTVSFVSSTGVTFDYRYPQPEDITPEQNAYITGYVNEFEKVLFGPDFADPVKGYARYINVDSHVDYDIFREFTRNFDGGSTFMFKPRGGKLTMGPLWDYNMALGNANYADGWDTEGWNTYYIDSSYIAWWCTWWGRLDDDPDYQQRWIDRWSALRRGPLYSSPPLYGAPTTASLDTGADSGPRVWDLMRDIDETADFIREAAGRNFERWPVLGTYVWANPDGYGQRRTFQSEVDWMKDWLDKRLTWMDAQFIEPPELELATSGAALFMRKPFGLGAILYTTDGSDPRLAGGAQSPKARVYGEGHIWEPLIPEGAEWRYLDDGSDQGTAWRETNYSAATWNSGPAQLGYGDGDEATVIEGGPEGNRHVTAYFRRTFDVRDVEAITTLTLRLLRDDGAVVYVNGREALRSNMRDGEIGYRSYARSSAGSGVFQEAALDTALLHSGENCLAVEVHRSLFNQYYMSFDLELGVWVHVSGIEPVPLAGPQRIVARVYDGRQWSAPTEMVLTSNEALWILY